MATKTITLELDAYEKLCAAKRQGDAFAEVVLADPPLTGAALREYYQKGGSGISDKFLDSIDEVARHDCSLPDPWTCRDEQ
jgi:hypothetical protein